MPLRKATRFGPFLVIRFGLLMTLSNDGVLTGLSQYPVFKVQAQGDTLRSVVPTVNNQFQASRCSCSSAFHKANAPVFGGAHRTSGRRMIDDRSL